MAQVKFYAKAEMPSENIDQNGIYFITTGGEIYKGATRFGCGRVTKASTAEEFAALSGMARGDINVGYEGAKVFDGTSWASLAASGSSVDPSQWRADIKTWTAGLVAGGTESIITQITQDEEGKVWASARAFPIIDTGAHDGEVQLDGHSAMVSGWDTLTSRVSDIESSVNDIANIVDVSGSAISAETGSFTNLTVTDTATFSVTNVSASALTINGSTVEQIADAQIAAISSSTATSTANGVTVGVTTSGGSVTAVSVNATSFGNVMHFAGVVSTPAEIATPSSGDIVVIGSQPDTGYVTGQEYIYTTASTWEVIGDQSTYALNAYSSTASVFNGVATVPGALSAAGSAIDAINTSLASLGDASLKSVANTIDTSATTLPTCSAVASYVDSALTWITD